MIANDLLFNQIWYRTKARIMWLFWGGTQEESTRRSSSITKLPQELAEMIISYFIYDTRSLLACSTTCYSWYIAAVPHLHHSLTTDDGHSLMTYDGHYFRSDRKYQWPRPLKNGYKLGLLPLVKRFRIRLGNFREFTPGRLGRRTLRYFSALTNLQELGIDHIQVSSFMPNIQQCFGHFSPTLRFLALKEPNGSCRQTLHFVGLFPNLQDLKASSSAIAFPRMNRRAQLTRPSFPSPYPHYEDG